MVIRLQRKIKWNILLIMVKIVTHLQAAVNSKYFKDKSSVVVGYGAWG